MSSLRPGLVATLLVSLAIPEVAHARRLGATEPAVPTPVAPAAAAPPAAAALPAAATVVPPAPVPATTPAPVAAPAADPWTAPSPEVVAVHVVSPPPPRPLPAPREKITEGNDLIAAGLASFGAFYFFTSLAGAVIVDKARDREIDGYTGERREIDTRRLNYGRALLVPVAGPFIALGFTDSAKERWGAALTGGVQATGIVLAAVGMFRKARARRAQRYSMGAGVASSGAMLSLSGRF